MPFFNTLVMAKAKAKAIEETAGVFTLKKTRPRTGSPKREQQLILFYKGGATNLGTSAFSWVKKTAARNGRITEEKISLPVATSDDLKALYDSNPTFQKTIQAPADYVAPWAKK